MEKFKEKTLSRHTVFMGKILNLRVDDVELPSGRTSKREVVEHMGAVAVVPVTEKGEVLLVRQYRYPVGCELLEIPAGKLEEGEKPLDCARRELSEETGWEAEKWEQLYCYFSSPGFSNEKLYMFCASDLKYKGQHTDEDENLEVVKVPLNRALDMIKEGTIRDGKTIIGLLSLKCAGTFLL